MAKRTLRESKGNDSYGFEVGHSGSIYTDKTNGRILLDASTFGRDKKVPSDIFLKCRTSRELIPFDPLTKSLTEQARLVVPKRPDLEYLQYIRRQSFFPMVDSLAFFLPGFGYLHSRGLHSDVYWKAVQNWIDLCMQEYKDDPAAIDRLAFVNANTAVECPLRPNIIRNEGYKVPENLKLPEDLHRAVIDRIWKWFSLSVHLVPTSHVKDRVNGLASAGPYRRHADGSLYSPSESDIKLTSIDGKPYGKYGVYMFRNTKEYKLSLINDIQAPFGAFNIHKERFAKTAHSDGSHYWTPDLIEWGLESGALPMETGGARKNSNDADVTPRDNWRNLNGHSKNRKYGNEASDSKLNWEVGETDNEKATDLVRKASPFKGIMAVPRTVCAISFQSQAVDKIFAKLFLGLWHNSPGYLPTIRPESKARREHFRKKFGKIFILGGDTSNFETFLTSNNDYIIERWPKGFQNIWKVASTVCFGGPDGDPTVVHDITASGKAYTSLDSGPVTTIATTILFTLEASGYPLTMKDAKDKALELVDHIFLGTPWVWLHDRSNNPYAIQMQGKSDDIYDRMANPTGSKPDVSYNEERIKAHQCSLEVKKSHEGFGLYTDENGYESFKDTVVINKLTTIYESPGFAPKDAFAFYSKAILFNNTSLINKWLDMSFSSLVGHTVRLSDWLPYVRDYVRILAEHGLSVGDLVNEYSPSEVVQFQQLAMSDKEFEFGAATSLDTFSESSRTSDEAVEEARKLLISEAEIDPSPDSIIADLRSTMSSYYQQYFDILLQKKGMPTYLGEYLGGLPMPERNI